MLSKTAQYAIKALFFISQKSTEGKKVPLKDIAKGIDAPEQFVAKILQNLTKKEIIRSSKGLNGGFFVDKSSEKFSLADVVKIFDGNKLFTQCGLGLKLCSENRPCPIHHEYKKVRKELIHILETTKFVSLNESLNEKSIFLKV